MYYTCIYYICITHVSTTYVLRLYFYTCISEGSTPITNVKHALQVFYTCITGVLHMYYRCMNYMFDTPKNNIDILHVYHMWHIL